MSQPSGRMPNKNIEDATTEWWKERIEALIQDSRSIDARSLYLEFTDEQVEK